MATQSLSGASRPSRVEWERISNDETFPSANGGIQAVGRTGNRWGLVLSWRNTSGARGAGARNYGALLFGKRHRLRVDVVTDLKHVQRGALGGGGITVTGAHTAGDTEVTIGGTGTINNWLLRGDFVEINGDLKMSRGDVNLSAGAATIDIWPELHADLAGGEGVDIDTPSGVFYMESESGFGSGPFRNGWLHEDIRIRLIEDVLD